MRTASQGLKCLSWVILFYHLSLDHSYQMSYKNHNTQKGKDKNVTYMIPQELTKVVFCSDLCTHILILGFIELLFRYVIALHIQYIFSYRHPSRGTLRFMLQARVFQLVDLLSRSTRYSTTFGELQIDSELY